MSKRPDAICVSLEKLGCNWCYQSLFTRFSVPLYPLIELLIRTRQGNIYREYFIPSTVDPTGMDAPGCDVGWARSVVETTCGLFCCATHDKCYHDNGCTSSSWLTNLIPFACESPCSKCNSEVADCLTNCALPWGYWPDEHDAYYDGTTDTFFSDPNDPRMGNSTTGEPRNDLAVPSSPSEPTPPTAGPPPYVPPPYGPTAYDFFSGISR
jgi:hypothetical protein